MSFLFDHLFPKPLEPVRQLRATGAAVCEFADEEGERLRVSSDPESASIHRIKTRVMDQLGSDIFGTPVVAAVHQARPSFFAFGFKHSEEHVTGNGVESQDDMGSWNFLCKLFRSRRSGAHDEFRVARIHREATGYDDLTRQIARQLQHIVDSRPMYGQQ
jgi:hypothetical protein